jgi:hypothetical protein
LVFPTNARLEREYELAEGRVDVQKASIVMNNFIGRNLGKSKEPWQ